MSFVFELFRNKSCTVPYCPVDNQKHHFFLHQNQLSYLYAVVMLNLPEKVSTRTWSIPVFTQQVLTYLLKFFQNQKLRRTVFLENQKLRFFCGSLRSPQVCSCRPSARTRRHTFLCVSDRSPRACSHGHSARTRHLSLSYAEYLFVDEDLMKEKVLKILTIDFLGKLSSLTFDFWKNVSKYVIEKLRRTGDTHLSKYGVCN